MTVYRFSETSAISEVDVRLHGDRPPVALLVAGRGRPQSQIERMRAEIEAYGWECVPALADGRNVMQVSGFKAEREFTGFLQDKGFTSGAPHIMEEARNDTDAKPSAFRRFLDRYSLALAGLLNLIGDIGFLGGGIKTGDKYKIAGGSFYTLGGLNLTMFGRHRKPEEGMRQVTGRMAELLRNMTGELPRDTGLSIADVHVQDERLGKAKDFLHNYAAQNTLGAYTAGAGAMLFSGIQSYRQDKSKWADLGYGISSFTLKLASLLIPESARNEASAHEKTAADKGLIGWIKEKPLRLFGYGSVITDSMLALGTYQDYRKDPKGKNYLWKAVTAVSYILADVMIAVSSKGPAGGKLNADEQRRAEALAAEIIARQPDAIQEKIVGEVADLLVKQPQVGGKSADIRASIREQVRHMRENPWASRVAEPASAQVASLG